MTAADPKDLLEFPCRYQFKAMGLAGDKFKAAVCAAVGKFASVSNDGVRCRPSEKGTYQAISVFVTLHSCDQLTSIYAELRNIEGLKMLL